MEIALDLETQGLNPWTQKCLLLTYTLGDKEKIVHVRGDARDVIESLRAPLEDPTIIKIIHRSSFDATWLAVEYGIFIRNIWDTKLMENILLGRGEIGKTSLLDTLVRHKFAKLNKATVQTFIGQQGYDFTTEQLHYAAADVAYLHKLKARQMRLLKKKDMLLLAQLENKVAEVTYRMRVTGVNFDRDKWVTTADQYEQEYVKIETELDGHYKNKYTKIKEKQLKFFDVVDLEPKETVHTKWSSPAQVKKRFGIANYKELKKGKDKWLNRFIDLHSLSKFITTYGLSWLENDRGPTIAPDGRVHTDFNQIVGTGRFSSMVPNLQQIPKGTAHRDSFIPAKGKVFVGADFTGQEIGIMAFGSQERVWLDALRNGMDVHGLTAQRLSTTRDHAKALNFGIAYGKGSKALAGELGIEETQARSILSKHKRQLKALNRWLKSNGDKAVEMDEARTLPPFSRYRDLSITKEEWHKRNQGYNTPVQGTGADIIKLALWYVHEALIPSAAIVLCIHDEILTEVDVQYADRWAEIMEEQMCRASDFITEPGLIKVKIEIKKSW